MIQEMTVGRDVVATGSAEYESARCGGHCFAGRSSTTGVVINLSGMNEVSVSDGTVAVGTGARLADVYNARAARDRTIAAGWWANRDQQVRR